MRLSPTFFARRSTAVDSNAPDDATCSSPSALMVAKTFQKRKRRREKYDDR